MIDTSDLLKYATAHEDAERLRIYQADLLMACTVHELADVGLLRPLLAMQAPWPLKSLGPLV